MKISTSKRRRFRFSLRTLLILVLLIGSSSATWWKWQPWVMERKFDVEDFSPDRKSVLVHESAFDFKVRETLSGRVISTLANVDYEPMRCEFSADGSRIISERRVEFPTCTDIREWDVATGREIKNSRSNPQNFELSPDGRLSMPKPHPRGIWRGYGLGDGDDNPTLTVQVNNFDPGGSDFTIASSQHLNVAEFTPDSKWIATADEAGEIRFWNSTDGSQHGSFNETGRIFRFAFTEDARLFAVENGDGTVAVWNREQAKRIGSFQPFEPYKARGMFFLRKQPWLVVWREEETVIWDYETQTEHSRPGALFCFSFDEQRVLSTAPAKAMESMNGVYYLRDDLIVAHLHMDFTPGIMIQIWHRRRLDGPWSYVVFFELWLTAALTVSLLLSIRNDRKF